MQHLRRPAVRLVAAGATVLTVVACQSDRLNVPDYNNPSSGPIASDPLTALSLLGTGILRTDRDNTAGFVLGTGIIGREAYNYTGTEGRNTTGYLTATVNLPTSFGGGSLWAGYYQNLRQIKTFRGVVESAPSAALSDGQRNAARGFAQTMDGLTLFYVIATRDSIGAPIDVDDDATKLTPFKSRDEVYAAIKARLDSGAASLTAAGTASIPFTLHSGMSNFQTAANFRKLNRAITARVNAYRASPGQPVAACAGAARATCYAEVLTNLSESFIDPAGALDAGAYRVYSTASGDVQNGIRTAVSAIVAHARTDSGVQVNAAGAKDKRFTDKVATIASRSSAPAGVGIATTNDFKLYSSGAAPIPLIKNEELILLRAEAKWYTGDQAGALADINTVRTRSGALDAIVTPFADEASFVTELLYNRRFSLLFEGHRWFDMRRFGRLNLLTIDQSGAVNPHIVVSRLPVPQAECLSRRGTDQPAPANSGCGSA